MSRGRKKSGGKSYQINKLGLATAIVSLLTELLRLVNELIN